VRVCRGISEPDNRRGREHQAEQCKRALCLVGLLRATAVVVLSCFLAMICNLWLGRLLVVAHAGYIASRTAAVGTESNAD
jgi:hypothetical protein